jgi:hypothetical protein
MPSLHHTQSRRLGRIPLGGELLPPTDGLVPSLTPEGASAGGTNTRAGKGSKGHGGDGAGGRSGSERKGIVAPQISFVGEPTIELVDGIASMVARFEMSTPTAYRLKCPYARKW